MANTIGTNGTHERQERYADAVLKLMRPALKIRNTFGRDYEGSPKAGAVKVPVRALDPKIRDYDVKNGIAPSQSATTYETIAIDNNKAINELIDGYEAEAVPDGLVAQRLEAGAYSVSKALEESAIEALKTGTASEQEDCTEANVYSNILKDIAILAKKGVDKNRMCVAIAYETETMLLTDEKFSNTASQIGAELAREGIVGKVNGVKVITEDLGEGVEYIVYGTDYAQAVDEFTSLPHIVDLEGSANYVSASALKGRMVYASAVTNKEAVIIKTKTA